MEFCQILFTFSIYVFVLISQIVYLAHLCLPRVFDFVLYFSSRISFFQRLEMWNYIYVMCRWS